MRDPLYAGGSAISKSFSILNLLLLISIIALGLALYRANRLIASKDKEVERLEGLAGVITDYDPELVHFRMHHRQAPHSFSFQVAAPIGSEYWLEVFEGGEDDGKRIFRCKIQFDSLNQRKISVYIHNSLEGHQLMGCITEGQSTASPIKRPLGWLDRLDLGPIYVAQKLVTSYLPGSEVLLYEVRQKTRYSLLHEPRRAPRRFRISLVPIK